MNAMSKKCDKKAGWIDAKKLIIASDIWQPSLFSIDIKPSIGFQQQLQDHCHNPIFQNFPTEKGNQISGQILTFHQRRFPWNKTLFLTKPPFGGNRSCEVPTVLALCPADEKARPLLKGNWNFHWKMNHNKPLHYYKLYLREKNPNSGSKLISNHW